MAKESNTTKPINTVQDDIQHVDNIHRQRNQTCQYPSTNVTVHLNEQSLTMKVDSGAEANIISAATYKKLVPRPTIRSSTTTLKSYGSPPLKLLRQLEANIKVDQKATNVTIYDLEILQITIDNQPIPINVHATP